LWEETATVNQRPHAARLHASGSSTQGKQAKYCQQDFFHIAINDFVKIGQR